MRMAMGLSLGGVAIGDTGPPPSPRAPSGISASISPASGTVGDTFTAVLAGDLGYPSGTPSYQWKLDGANIGGSTGASTVSAAPGSLTVQVSVTNASGTAGPVTSSGVTVSAAVVAANSIASATSVGTPTATVVMPGVVTPNGIASATSVGALAVTGARTIAPNNIASASSVGTPTATVASSEDAATTAWAAALTTAPTSGRRTLVNTLITGIKADDDWAGLDWLAIWAGETSQAARVNIRNPAKIATFVNSPTFLADRGVTGDGGSSYIDLGEAHSAGGNFTLDSAAIGFWINQQNSTTRKQHVGTVLSVDVVGSPRGATGLETFRVNDGTSDTLQSNTGSKVGHRCISRTASNVKEASMNGVQVASFTTASTALPTNNATVLRGGTEYDDSRSAAYYHGAGMSAAARTRIHNRLNTFLTAIGAN